MINPITNTISAVAVKPADAQPATGPSFASVLRNALDQVAGLEVESAKLSQQLAAGQGPDLHTVMIASEKATLAIQLTTQVRNKVVDVTVKYF